MTRGLLLARRARGHGGLLVLVAVLVAVAAFAACTAVGTLRAAASEALVDGFATAGDEATFVVMSRPAPDAAGAAEQDAAVRAIVGDELAGLPYTVTADTVALPDVSEPLERWTVSVDLDRLTAADLTGFSEGAARLTRALHHDDVASGPGLRISGGLAGTASEVAALVRASTAVTLVPLWLLVLVGLVALTQVARLLAAARATEVGLVVSRGASPRQVTVASGVEALLLCSVASAVGVGAAMVTLGARGASLSGGAGRGVLAVGLVVVVLAAGTMTLVAGLQARSVAARRVVDRSGRLRQATAVGTVVLTVAAAAVTLWLLLRYGTPLVPTPSGGRVDPAAAAAPALVLAAVALLATLGLGPATRGWERGAAGRPGLVGALAARQVSRRISVAVVPVVLLTLAGGAVVVTAAFTATAERVGTETRALANGADVRVVYPPRDTPDPVARFEELPGAAAAAPALTDPGTVQGEPFTAVALPADQVGDVLTTVDGAPDPASLAAAMGDDDPFADALPLPAGTRTLDLRLTGRLFFATEAWPTVPVAPSSLVAEDDKRGLALMDKFESSAVGVSLWFVDADGRLTRVEAGQLDHDPAGTGAGAHPIGPEPSTQELSMDVPAVLAGSDGAGERGAGRLVALELTTVGTTDWVVSVDVSLDAVTATTDSGEQVPLDLTAAGWSPAADLGGSSLAGTANPGTGPAVEHLYPRGTTPKPYRMTLAHRVPVVPGVFSAALVDLLDLEPGQQVELPLSPGGVRVLVADVVEVVPGALQPYAVLVDLPTLNARYLDSVAIVPATNEVWVAASSPDRDTLDTLDALGRAAAGVAAPPADGVTESGVRVSTVTGGLYGGRSEVVPRSATSATGAGEPAVEAFRLAALGAVLLALVGLGAVAVTGLGARRGEVVALRATGVPPRAQGAGRAVELVAVGLVATCVGLVAGGLVAALTVPGLARGTVTGVAYVPAAGLVLSPAIALVGVLVLAAGVAAVALVVRSRVLVQARDTEYREEVR